jgi:hypothetical protein
MRHRLPELFHLASLRDPLMRRDERRHAKPPARVERRRGPRTPAEHPQRGWERALELAHRPIRATLLWTSVLLPGW